MYLHKQGGMNQRWVIWEGEPFSSWACSEKKRSHLQFLECFCVKAPKPEYPSLNFSWFAKILPQW